jgi:hypothetical protein
VFNESRKARSIDQVIQFLDDTEPASPTAEISKIQRIAHPFEDAGNIIEVRGPPGSQLRQTTTALRSNPKRTESSNQTIHDAEIRRPPARAIKDQQLVSGKNGFRDYGSHAT